MGLSDGKLTLPMSLADVARCLGVDSGDLGTLCRSKEVNVWAKYKPVEYPHVRHEDDEWWRGGDGCCGLTPPTPVNKISDIPSLFDASGWNGWGRTFPSTWYRLCDFDGYDHSAAAPVRNFSVTQTVSEEGTVRAIAIQSVADDAWLLWTDLAVKFGNEAVQLEDLYFGFALEREDGTVLAQTADSPGVMNASATAAKLGLEAGDTYTAYPFLSTAALTTTSSDQQVCKMFALPGLSPQGGQCVTKEEAQGIVISFKGYYMYGDDGTTTGATWIVGVKNDGAGSSLFPFRKNQVQLRFGGSAVADALEAGEQRAYLPDIEDIEDGATWTRTGTFAIPSAYASKSFYLYLTLRTATYTRKITLNQLAAGNEGWDYGKVTGTLADTTEEELFQDVLS